MARSLSKCISLLGLLVALAGCELDGLMVIVTPCFDPVTETYVPCCDKGTKKERPCDPADAGADAATDASDDGDADAGADDGGPAGGDEGSSLVCPWSCTPVGGGGFDPFPSYVWIGPEATSPPETLDGFAWTSWVDVKFADPNCPACSCIAPSAPADGCVLPAVWTVESTACQDPSLPVVAPFDPPLNWDGMCSSTNPIASGLTCDGEPCVKSLVLQPPVIAPCFAESAMPPEGQTLAAPTRTKVVAYVAASVPSACDATHHCITPPPEGYKSCFVARGADAVEACPEGWTDRYTGWRDVSDTRACTACSCGAPEGASCKVRAKVYADDACIDEAGSLIIPSNEDAKCVDLPVGTALGSQTAEILSYQEGTCTPSTSEIVGEAVTARPVTFCCVPELQILE